MTGITTAATGWFRAQAETLDTIETDLETRRTRLLAELEIVERDLSGIREAKAAILPYARLVSVPTLEIAA